MLCGLADTSPSLGGPGTWEAGEGAGRKGSEESRLQPCRQGPTRSSKHIASARNWAFPSVYLSGRRYAWKLVRGRSGRECSRRSRQPPEVEKPSMPSLKSHISKLIEYSLFNNIQILSDRRLALTKS